MSPDTNHRAGRHAMGCYAPRMLRRRPLALLSTLVLAALTSSCGDKSAVSVTVTVTEPQLSVEEELLGFQVTGSFGINLQLGKLAESGTSVTLDDIALTPSDNPAQNIEPFDPVATSGSFPVSLSPGDSSTVGFTLEGGDLIDQAGKDTLCAGAVKLRGSVRDSGDPVQFESAPITVDGC